MEIVLSIFVVTICLVCLLRNSSYLVACFLVFRILIPENVRFWGTGISINSMVVFFMLASLLIKKKIAYTKQDKKYVVTQSIFVVYCLLTLFLANCGNLQSQILVLLEFVYTQILPSIIAVLLLHNEKGIEFIDTSFLVATIISCVYGIITYFARNNIYIEILAGKKVEDSVWKGYATYATFISTTTFGYFLAIALPYALFLLFYSKSEKVKKAAKVAIPLMFIGVILCKKRSAFIAIASMVLMLVLLSPKTKKNINKVVIVVCVAIALLIVIRSVPGLEKLDNFVTASIRFWDDKAVDVGRGSLGSSMELRIRQFMYPFIEIKRNYIFGHGFGWCTWYLDTYKLHPILYGFESIFATGICELGVLGFIVYPLWLFFLYRYCLNSRKLKTNIILIYFLTYVVDIVASGMNYLFLFLILIVLMNKHQIEE